MKKYVLLGIAVLCAAAAFAVDADVSPGAAVGPTPSPGFYPAWGSLVRSFTITGGGSTYTEAGIAATYDGYICCGPWQSWTAFTVYTTTGSFVRTVPISTPANGYRDGTGKNHLGTGYIVISQLAPYSYPYTAGGTPGGSGTVLFSGPAGRGIGWDGTYYYVTTGSYGTAIGVYTTTGSQVRTFTGSWAANLYGVAGFVPANGYVYVATQSPHSIAEVDATTGSIIRSFSSSSSTEGGLDFGYTDGYFYLVDQGSTGNQGIVRVFDSGLSNAVEPSSLGKLKAIYR
jgi:hypothetical protein